MGLIGNNEEIIREEVDECKRRTACLSQRQMTGIVLNARTESHFLQHFNIIIGTLCQSLGFQQLVLPLQLCQTFFQFRFNTGNGQLHFFRRSDIVGCWINGNMISGTNDFPCYHVDFRDAVDFVAEKFHTDSIFRRCHRENFYYIAPHTKGTAFKIHIISVILHFNEDVQHFIPVFFHTGTERKHHAIVFFRVTQTIDTGYAGNNNNILPFHQCRCGRVTQFIDFFIDCGIFLNIGIGAGHIGFRLIVIIITDEILYRVFREKFLQFIIKLGCQCFIMGNDQRGFLYFFNDVCHGKGFPGTRYPHQSLKFQSILKSIGYFFDSLGLVASGLKFGMYFKWFVHDTPPFTQIILVQSSL